MNSESQALPEHLYRADQVRELDRCAIEDHGIAGFALMQRAAAAAYTSLLDLLQREHGKRILVVCGSGNNGGDGYLIARLARLDGHPVQVLALAGEEKLRGDALTAARAWREASGPILEVAETDFETFDVIVDCLLGTGLERDVSGPYHSVIEKINQSSCAVLAVDIPSGLSADTGQPMGVAVRADRTISFIGLKQGLFTGAAADYCGQIDYADLGVPEAVLDSVECQAQRLSSSVVQRALPRRSRNSHKGMYGHVLVVGGAQGMAGAAIMAGQAGLRAGAGLVTLATDMPQPAMANIRQPELMSYRVEVPTQLSPLLSRATTLAIGPGLGVSDWAQQMFATALDSAFPLVVDADALNLLADNQVARGNWVLTPHPGEAARLLKCKVADIQADRFAAVREVAERYQALTVLKGSGSLIAGPSAPKVMVCDRGHPGMASGGMGDVLTGVIAGLLAQSNNVDDATNAGVWLHAVAAEEAALRGERGILATDLLVPLQVLVNEYA